MDWYDEINSALSQVDEHITRMRDSLSSSRKEGKGREKIHESDLDLPLLPSQPPLVRQASPSLSSGVQWTDLAAIQSLLKIQSQAIESLTKKLHEMEQERQFEKLHIQTLQDELHRLRERKREREEQRWGQGPGAERLMGQWTQELGQEIHNLWVHSTTSLGNQEESLSSTVKHLQRELEHLKTRLRRHEEDEFLQQTKTGRQCEESFQTLEELRETDRKRSAELVKILSQCSQTKEEICQIRRVVLEIKEEVRSLALREQDPESEVPPLPLSRSRRVRGEDEGSDSEDSSLTPSLAEVSSDSLSRLDDRDPALPALLEEPRVHLKVQLGFTASRSDLEDDLHEKDVTSDFGSDLSLGDL